MKAFPKSSSFTFPSPVTSTFEGLRSRWKIKLECACATATALEQMRAFLINAQSASAQHDSPDRGRKLLPETAPAQRWLLRRVVFSRPFPIFLKRARHPSS
jgi:hypothetical protein